MKLSTALATALLAQTAYAAESVHFTEVTQQWGINSTPTWKYGGPALADLNDDGRQDLLLGNHHIYPAQLFMSTDHQTFKEGEPVLGGDVHGIAAGDYDRDGRIDLVVSVGGGNGTNPQPPRLLRNTGDGFEDMTIAAGIGDLGARGRSVRWFDPDIDGDLDLLQINARQLPGESGPRNILFENLGGGKFLYRSSPVFEPLEAERVLVTDLNRDHLPDLVTFTPLRILIGQKDFQFIDATSQWLPGVSEAELEHVMAVAEADVDNDGDMDLYVARGKTYYEIANNALEFDAESGRMDLRDEGNEGQDAVDFSAGETIGLQDFFHWPRGIDITLPVYLGLAQTPLDTPVAVSRVNAADATGFPEKLEHDGWYLGYLGDNEWRLAWNLNGNLAWDLRASVTGVTKIKPHWQPQQLGVQDHLLINQGDHFLATPEALPKSSGDNNWGVISADFNNDMRSDFFIYRFGRLHGRTEDVLLLNTSADGKAAFTESFKHGANNIDAGGHGDMGAPLDFDADGWMDVLSGSDDQGSWHLYRNTPATTDGDSARSLSVRVGYSPNGADAQDAEVHVIAGGETQFKRVGSFGTVHSQSLNNKVHFGLGKNSEASQVRVLWRDGSEMVRSNLPAGSTEQFGTPKPHSE